jgi:signal transduction histidine kinase
VQKIVQDHGGEVSVERTPDAKTVFRVVLPGRVAETFSNTVKAPAASHR